ncbi:High-affinity zinc uptake system ATP-binding protein ZnuC [Jeotgalicoccus aerolatus]|uniref:Zinc transport system ATP-binding protein n=1 Tax=Jeotgalicoccus aerolatus TaxID=709510 RepID=A0A1G8UN82_9STAP|nr:metal ABC transporter ATP-binding protein [Jeotgalicoccus aerolatus]MBP1951703.1 zinc transport system ATP-binding protein [Jeotgalicoccus aerolatus]NMA80469.1 metal ABC transporter ATP-binding protein [Jeotgalicoccus aerolatus]CAD2075524.1 High-affinity zinc uptake system ATP-binding protein ZnuC [Jeotgalicoccus aerolatus]SDJ55346.1 zinc transport system ATP-binding protein [Jeotgalicoccus aerolatus]GGD95471.1 zinc ABC transporter ATP-binding protein [Jeotgalicoccus aerolatus]
MAVPVFEIKDVTYEYKDKMEATPALQNISFSINEGEFLAIVGPNGSGKSTLLKLILGVYKLQQGQILINGKNRKSFNAWQDIGYVSQKAAAHAKGFPATVKEVVLSGLTKEKGLFKRFNRKDNEQLDKTLELLDISHIKYQNVSNLSGGQAQRVFIARALINNPSILVLDEPTEGIDSKHVKDFYNVLFKLKEKDVTILLVTHDIGVVVDNADRVACLNEHLHFHGTNTEFQNLGEAELSKIYGFPLQLVSHNHQRECCK